MRKSLLIASVLTGLIAACTMAQAQVRIGVGIGVPVYRPYPYRYYPYPYPYPYRVYVAPPPVYVAPAPVYVAPAPGAVVYPQPAPVYAQPAPVYAQPAPVAQAAPVAQPRPSSRTFRQPWRRARSCLLRRRPRSHRRSPIRPRRRQPVNSPATRAQKRRISPDLAGILRCAQNDAAALRMTPGATLAYPPMRSAVPDKPAVAPGSTDRESGSIGPLRRRQLADDLFGGQRDALENAFADQALLDEALELAGHDRTAELQ